MLKNTILVLLALTFLSTYSLQAQYCTASASCDEYIGGVEFNTISNTGTGCSGGYADYSAISTSIFMGKSYTMTVTNPVPYSGDQAAVWIDYNQNYTFDSGEQTTLTTSDNKIFSGTVSIPTSAKAGTTRMRVRLCYTGTLSACGALSWGETEDYTVNLLPPPPDAAFTTLTSPTVPFSVGIYPVKAILTNNSGDATLTSANISWSVNGVTQGSFPWTGSLKKGETQEILLGNYSFTYPEGSSFNPFSIKVEVSNANGFAQDGDPTNDILSKSIAPTLNDCGAIGFFGPPEGFGPGVTQVRARVRNYAPKPLSSVTINWKIDNVDQTPITITGLSIKEGQYQDLVVGTYTFYNKTPLGPFNVEVSTSKPNGVNDEDPSNDKYTGGIGPSLVAGTYTIGGFNYHFANLVTAASYLNSSGVFGKGTVILEIRPGTYTGQILLNNQPANGNPLIIKSSTNKYYDVVINAAPTNKDNYVMQINGYSNIELQNITFQNTNSNSSLAGVVLDVANATGTKLTGVLLSGVANSPKDEVYSLLKVKNAGLEAVNSMFANGSVAANIVDDFGTSNINISKNSFSNFTWSGTKAVSNGVNKANFIIDNNSYKWESGLVPSNGVWIAGKAQVTGNTFTGINGSAATDAVIKVENTGGNYVNIIGNAIESCSNINAIRSDNGMIYVNKNYINVAQTQTNTNAVVFANMSGGFVGNNMLLGTNIYAFNIQSSNNIQFLYNSVETSGNRAAVMSNNSAFGIMRNIFNNKGTTNTYDLTGGTPNLKENVHYNASGSFARVNGVNYAKLADLQVANMELGSRSSVIEFKKLAADLHIALYTPELLFGYPLFGGDNGYAGMIEGYDYDGEARSSFYAGLDEIFLRIVIARQSEGFIDCENTDYNRLTVSGEINYGASMTYQWEKDGLPIKGETEPVLYFPKLDFLQSGLYRCLIMGPGTTAPVYSKPVAVYVATPTVITRQPENQIIPIGTLATFKFDAHVNGKNIEEALYDYQVSVQWFKYVNESQSTPLKEDSKFSGTKSNYLTIKGFTKADAGKYFAEIKGLCGTVKTSMVELVEEVLEVTITKQPDNVTECVNSNAVFSVDATTQSTKQINYVWYKDGAVVKDVNGKITGSTTKTLTISGLTPADAGEYWAVANLEGTVVQKSTNKATLTVNNVPQIITNLTDISITSGGQGTLEVLLEDMEDPNLKFEWYKDGNKVAGEDLSLLLIEDAQAEDGGEYWCVITNGCGSTTSAKATVTVTTSGSTDVEEVSRNGYTLRSAVPNPVNSLSMITFTTPVAANVKITLNGMSGEEIAVLLNSNVNAGENFVKINASDLKLSSGTYFVKFESNGTVLFQKVTVIK